MTDPLLSGIVRIQTSAGKILGTGFVLSRKGHIATCAHVIQTRQDQQTQQPRPETVIVRFQAAPEERPARIVHWVPTVQGDIALLGIEGKLPAGVRPLHLGSAKMTRGHEIYTFGYPSGPRGDRGAYGSGKAYGIVSDELPSTRELLQLQSQEIKAGFSGAPVWDVVRDEVIGMIAQQMPRDVHGQTLGIFAVTTDRLSRAFEHLEADIAVSSPPVYVGARHYYEGERPLFCGFDRQIDKLISRLQHLQRQDQQPAFLALLGPASSGKTSLIQAGLVPALREDAVPGSKDWHVLHIQTAEQPYEQLAAEGLVHPERGLPQSIHTWYLDHPQCKRLVLILDQFEVALTRCAPETLHALGKRPAGSHVLACPERGRPGPARTALYRSESPAPPAGAASAVGC
jgi:hypothetical protein